MKLKNSFFNIKFKIFFLFREVISFPRIILFTLFTTIELKVIIKNLFYSAKTRSRRAPRLSVRYDKLDLKTYFV